MATAPQFHFIYECGSSYIGVSPTYEVRTVATSVLIKKTITKIFRPLYRIFIKIRKKKLNYFVNEENGHTFVKKTDNFAA